MSGIKDKSLCFVRIFIKRSRQASLVTSSAVIAFYTLLSLFPFLILLGNMLPLFHITSDVMVEYLSILIPSALLPTFEPIVTSLLNSSSGSLLSISTLVLLWSSSRATSCVQNCMNAAYGIRTDRSYLMRRFVGFLSVFLFLVLVGALLLFFSFSDILFSFFEPLFSWLGTAQNWVDNLKWPVVILFVFLLLMLVYLIAPSAKVRFFEAIPGAVFATIGLLALVQLFALYVRVATRSLTSYGALSSFFILMFWLEYSAMTVVVGALFNASIREFRFGEDSLRPSKLDEWDTFLDDKLMGYFQKKWNARKARMQEKKQAGQNSEKPLDSNDSEGDTHG